MQSDFQIYGLVCPLTQELRYVGRSSSGIKRICRHWRASEVAVDKNLHKKNWIQKLARFGLIPEVVIIQSFADASPLDAAEKYWISYFKALGSPLLNILSGGNDRTLIDIEVYAKWKRNTQEALDRPEYKAKISAASKAYWAGLTEEQLEERRQIMSDKWQDPEYRNVVGAKISATRKGKPVAKSSADGLRLSSEKRRIPVIGTHLDSGLTQTFESVMDAAAKISATPSNISGNIKGRVRHVKRWTFRKLKEA